MIEQEMDSMNKCDKCGKPCDEVVHCIDMIGKAELGCDRSCGTNWCRDCYEIAQESSVAQWYHKLGDWDGDNNTDLCPRCARNPLGIENYGVFVEDKDGTTYEIVLPDELMEGVFNYITSQDAIEALAKEFKTRKTGMIIPKDTKGKILW